MSRLDLDKMVEYAMRLDTAVTKRLGWVLERLQADQSLLERLESIPITGYRTLDANGPRKGPCNPRWMIQENLPGKKFA